jgi:hypothetical protein
MDITDRIIEKYKKDRSIKDGYVLNDDEMYLIDEIVQLKIGQTLPIDSVSVSLFDEALKLMRDLAEHQNGAPLIRHEEEYNNTMTEVWDFLEANET